jgi:hypothetical protein
MDDMSYSIAAGILRFNPNDQSDVNDLNQVLKSVKDWPQLINVLMAQGVFLLFYQAIKSLDAKAVAPGDVLESMKTTQRNLTVINLAQQAATEKLLNVLNRTDIPVLMPKGLFLDHVVYPEPYLRFSNDIDIFVKDADLDKAYTLLISRGFRDIPNKHGIALSFSPGNVDVMIELETLRRQKKARFRETYVWNPDEIWSKAVPQELCRGSILRMTPEHQVIFLALHLSERHQFERLIWFRDIAEVIRRYSAVLDWDSVIEIAKAWNAAGYVYFSLLFANRLAGENVPDNVLEKLKPRYLSGKLFEKYAMNNRTPVFPLSRRSLLFQLFSIIGDSSARRLWAEALLPYHAACHYAGIDPHDIRPKNRLKVDTRGYRMMKSKG